MKVNYPLFFSLIGDYYLHAHTPTHSQIITNNETSLVIEDVLSHFNLELSGFYMFYGDKYTPKIGIAILDGVDNIKMYNIQNQEIFPEQIITQYSDKPISPTELIKIMQNRHIEKTLFYYFYDNRHIFSFLDFMTNIDINIILKSVIKKLLLLSPETISTIHKLVSVILGAPIVESNMEIVKKIDFNLNKIFTDKNEYIFSLNGVTLPKEGDVIKFGEPIFLIGELKKTLELPLLYLSILNKKSEYMSLWYAQKLFSSLLYNHYTVVLPLDYVTSHMDNFKKLPILLKNLRTVMVETISNKIYSSNVKYSSVGVLKIESKFAYSVKETFLFKDFSFDYLNDEKFFFTEKESKVIKDNNDFSIKRYEAYSATKKENELHIYNESNDTVHKENESGSFNENISMWSKMVSVGINEIIEQYENTYFIYDKIELFKDLYNVTILDKNKYQSISTDSKTILANTKDYFTTPEDKINYYSVSKENVINAESISYNSLLALVETGAKLKDKNTQYIETFDNLAQNDKININSVAIENVSNIETLNISSEISSKDVLIATDNMQPKEIVRAIYTVHDSMDVDTDTNIDKEW